MKKFFKITALVLAGVVFVALAYVFITFPPILAGMAAKTMCSCVYISGRTYESVRDKELKVFPGLSSATVKFDNADSSVTAGFFWKSSKAIFRKGLGCTLLAERTEEEVRNHKFNLAGPPRVNPDSIAWPMGNVSNNTASSGVNKELITVALDSAFADQHPEKPKFTLAVVAVYDGQIVGERYAPGVDINSKLMGWSMTKSIVNALIGILVKEGKLDPTAPAPIEQWKDDDRKEITLNNLLQMNSGLDWFESYFIPTSPFHNMFIKSDDKSNYALNRKLKHKPGEFFEYSSGTTNILSRIIRQTVGDENYYRFPYEKLFYKAGMNHMVMEPDASGTFVGSSYSYGTARDWARFGLLYLNDGVSNGERILPEGWVNYTTTASPATPIGQYGAQWWLNKGAKDNSSIRKIPGLPVDAYWADGFEEQWVMVIPSRKLVVVRLGISHHGSAFPTLVNDIIKALPEN